MKLPVEYLCLVRNVCSPKMANVLVVITLLLIFSIHASSQPKDNISAEQTWFQVPVLKGKAVNPLLRIKITTAANTEILLNSLTLSLKGSTKISDIARIQVYFTKSDSTAGRWSGFENAQLLGESSIIKNSIVISGKAPLLAGPNYIWVSCQLNTNANLLHFISARCEELAFDHSKIIPQVTNQQIKQRLGIAVRQHNQDNVHTYRIPGLTTSTKGTLLAVYDVRRESGRDLQGHMDIGLSRSHDQGNTWDPMQIVLDMKTFGGLPEKFNGVSDACILSDDKTGTLYIAGLWMHGVLNDQGEWIEGLNENSDVWNHQWRNRGSQPGFGIKETAQFLVIKSEDDGKTWGEPVNLTSMCKQEEWWLWAPAPGHGITLRDGTLVFPTQGRDKNGTPFSNITFSKDGGKNWETSVPADSGSTTECSVVQLSNGDLMLNMRANENKYIKDEHNGRAIAVTSNLGKSWENHASSRSLLPESVCMAALHRFKRKGSKESLLLFSNPNSKYKRNFMTIKASADDGMSWPEENWVLLDEWPSYGYSSITSIDKKHVGILYEGSGSQMVFQKIPLKSFLKK